MKYLIQTIEGEIKHDFSFTLLQSFDYYKWLGEPKEYKLSDNILNEKGWIPIGTVEFVIEYLKTNYGLEPKPINIPEELRKPIFTQRTIFYGDETLLKELNPKFRYFVKSEDGIKKFTDIMYTSQELENGKYLYSELVDIESEYRCFVFDNRLVGMQNYSGEFTTFPDMSDIHSMISEYKSSPVSYTLDIGVLESGETVIIEVHDFFSCGLYGFDDMALLPMMYSRWFIEYLRKNNMNIE